MMYEVEWKGVRIYTNHIIDTQHLICCYPSLRFIGNPLPDRRGFFTISVGGEGPDIAAFQRELDRVGYIWEEKKPKRRFFRR